MKTSLFALQGLVCDRYTSRAMVGAGILAEAFAQRLTLTHIQKIGLPSDPHNIQYQACLKEADDQLRAIYNAVHAATKAGHFPVLAANRCGATLASISAGFHTIPRDTVLLWVDAHGDYHTPDTTETGYLGGMVISALCGVWDAGFPPSLTPDRVVLAGCRDLEDNERAALTRDAVPVIEGQKDGTLDIDAVIKAIRGRPVWLHIDCDVIDPNYITTEYKVPKGLMPESLKALVARIADTSILQAIEITEFDAHDNPDILAHDVSTIMDILEPVFKRIG